MEEPGADGGIFNVGSGRACTINEVAAGIARALGKENVGTEVTGSYRVGDVRHCYADISRAREVLGYEPRVSFEAGIEELAGGADRG